MKTTINFSKFIITFGIVILFAELFMYGSKISNTSITEFYEDIGRGRRKNFEYITFSEGIVISKFNNSRYIGEEVAQNKPKNTLRFALLGDSFVESYDVFERQYFGNLTKEKLKKQTNQNIEILNLGRSGFDLGDMYAYYELYAKNFNADYYLFFVGNHTLRVRNSDNLRPKVIVENDEIIIDNKFNKNDVDKFKINKIFTQNSHIASMIANSVKKSEKIHVGAILFGKFYQLFNEEKLNENIEKVDIEVDPTVFKIFDKIANDKIIIVFRDNLALPENIIEYINNKKIKNFDIGPTLNKMIDEGTNPYYWPVIKKDGHWNQEAHKQISEVLSDYLEKEILNQQ